MVRPCHRTHHDFVAALLARSPELAGLASLARRFRSVVREQRADELDGLLAAVKGTPLAGFADGIRRDVDAIRAAATLPWSTGSVEGQISRLKTIKRMRCGRAGFELLRQRIIQAA
jgi:transposase